ncbi:hypothetical protein B0T24DRAFT_522066, partial [Lasiosphaeria ovina]
MPRSNDKWETKEFAALCALSDAMVRVFVDYPRESYVAEAAALSSVVRGNSYEHLYSGFVKAITMCATFDGMMNPEFLLSFEKVLHSPDVALDGVSLGAALQGLKKNLAEAIVRADKPTAQYNLVRTLSAILDTMNEVKTAGLGRVDVHEPLLRCLDKLRNHEELRLAQAARYAFQALLGVSNDEGPWKALWRYTYNLMGIIAGAAAAAPTLDPTRIFNAADLLQQLPVDDLVRSIVGVIREATQLSQSLSEATRGIGFLQRQKKWYLALRFTDMLINSHAFDHLERVLPEIPCGQEPEFLCGLCEQLERAHTTDLRSRGRISDFVRDKLLNNMKTSKDKRVRKWVGLVAHTFSKPEWGDSGKPRSHPHTAALRKMAQHTFGGREYYCEIQLFSPNTQKSLPRQLLDEAWLCCPEARLLYTDLALQNFYLSDSLLEVQRLSRASLPMDLCYINLVVVVKPDVLVSGSSRLEQGNFEWDEPNHVAPLVQMTPFMEEIQLDEIFNARRNDTEIWPRRVLIHGQAGVGKTTLCKKMVYDFVHGRLWTDIFDRVLWVPLRHLKGWTAGGSDFFGKRFFLHHGDGDRFGGDLWGAIMDKRYGKKTLFILDGLDEVSCELDTRSISTSAGSVIKILLSQQNVIITSRPYGPGPPRMDLTLETIGFHPHQVKDYIGRCAPPGTAEAIWTFVKSHSPVEGITRIPIMLDGLCYGWKSIASIPGSEPTTMTALYKSIEKVLWIKDVIHLEKSRPGARSPLVESDLRAATLGDIIPLVQAERNFLQSLSFSGLVGDAVEFDPAYRALFQNHVDEFTKFLPQPKTAFWSGDLNQLSFIRTSDMETADENRSYHFIHLTFQEFFAAQYFVEHFKAGRQLVYLCRKKKRKSVSPGLLLRKKKYASRLCVMWR